MSLDRREVLQLAGGVALVGATAGLGFVRLGPSAQTGTLLRSQLPLPERFRVPLPIPAVKQPQPDRTRERYEITQQAADVEIIPGYTTAIWGYDGSFPGPTIKAQRGRPAMVRFRNQLSVPTSVHLHGGRTPPDSDGHPADLVMPAGSGADPPAAGNIAVGRRDHEYPLDQRAATLWYHDHAMDGTGRNLYQGLAGFFILSDEEEENLPLPRGERDIPLMICDRAFDGDGALRYPARSSDHDEPGVEDRYLGGVLGDVILVNGRPWPFHEVGRARYRLRFLNASNARRYRLGLDASPPGGPTFLQVGTDGGLLASPLERDTVTLAPAERADVVVDFSRYPVGRSVTLTNRLGRGSTSEIMRFEVVRRGVDNSHVPEQLGSFERLERADATTTRTFAFTLRRDDGDSDGGGLGDQRWMINKRVFAPDEDIARPALDDVEIWRFMTDLHHPVHIHLAHFQVLAPQRARPRPRRPGLEGHHRSHPRGDRRGDRPLLGLPGPLRRPLPQPGARGHGHDGQLHRHMTPLGARMCS